EAVPHRDQVNTPGRDRASGRLDLDAGAAHRPQVRSACGPLLDDQVLAEVLAPRLEREIGEDGEDSVDRPGDFLPAFVDVAGRVILEDRVVGVHGDDGLDVVVAPG